jgi:hypothetical protein
MRMPGCDAHGAARRSIYRIQNPMRTNRWMMAGAAAVLAVAPVAAQVPGTPRALGMGGAYVGVARGVESLFQNPANLALPGSPHWSAAFPTLSAGLGTRGISLGQAVDLAEWGDLDDAEREAIFADVPAGGTGLDVDVRAPVAALQMRRFAASVSYGTIGSHTVNKSIVDLLFNGFDQDKTYTIDDTEGFRASFWDIAAAYDESAALPGTRALASTLRGERDAGLPMTLRAGAAYQLRSRTTLAAAYQKELDEDTPFGGLWDQQLSVGVQQRVWILGLRAGLATDLGDGNLFSGGLSVGPVHLGVAHVATGSGDDERSGWIATFGLGGQSDTKMQ